MSFNSKRFISDIHWISTGGKPNPKPNPIPNPNPNLKTMGEKSSLNPIPQDPKPTDIRPKPDPLSSLLIPLDSVWIGPSSAVENVRSIKVHLVSWCWCLLQGRRRRCGRLLGQLRMWLLGGGDLLSRQWMMDLGDNHSSPNIEAYQTSLRPF
jgi:hypothetical protein